MTRNFIKDTAAGIVKSIIDALLVREAEYDAFLANAAAQKEKERKEYLDMQARKADADDRMWLATLHSSGSRRTTNPRIGP